MTREFRTESPPFDKARGWLDAEGNLTVKTAARFATPYAIYDRDAASGYTRVPGEHAILECFDR